MDTRIDNILNICEARGKCSSRYGSEMQFGKKQIREPMLTSSFDHTTRSSCHRLEGYIPNHSDGLDSDSRMRCPFEHLLSTLIRWNTAMDVRHYVESRREGFKLKILKSISILIFMQGTNYYGYRTAFNRTLFIIVLGSLGRHLFCYGRIIHARELRGKDQHTSLASYRAGCSGKRSPTISLLL